MNPQFFYLFLLSFSPVLVFLLHIIAVRIYRLFKPKASPLSVVILAILAGYVVEGVWVWQSYLKTLRSEAGLLSAALYGLLVYSGLSFCYFIVFNMTESARRIHMLRELYVQKQLSLGELDREYNVAKMLSVRLERLTALGQLRKVEGRYFLRERILYYAGLILSSWAKLIGFSHEKNFPKALK